MGSASPPQEVTLVPASGGWPWEGEHWRELRVPQQSIMILDGGPIRIGYRPVYPGPSAAALALLEDDALRAAALDLAEAVGTKEAIARIEHWAVVALRASRLEAQRRRERGALPEPASGDRAPTGRADAAPVISDIARAAARRELAKAGIERRRSS